MPSSWMSCWIGRLAAGALLLGVSGCGPGGGYYDSGPGYAPGYSGYSSGYGGDNRWEERRWREDRERRRWEADRDRRRHEDNRRRDDDRRRHEDQRRREESQRRPPPGPPPRDTGRGNYIGPSN